MWQGRVLQQALDSGCSTVVFLRLCRTAAQLAISCIKVCGACSALRATSGYIEHVSS
jgi:hypothetical protein